MSHVARTPVGAGVRVLSAALAALPIAALTLAPRRFVAPARGAFMDLAHRVAAPIVEPMTYGQLESTLNAALFVPLGAAIALVLRARWWLVAPITVFLVSFGIEYAQAQIPGRVPDASDVVWNTIGGVLGALVIGLARLVSFGARRR
ncbi:VanZ family protein [Microbacterium sp. NPDC055903]